MSASPPVAAVLLAAGRAERYGGGKLGERLTPGVTVLARSLLGVLAPESGVDGGVWVVGRPPEIKAWLDELVADSRVHLVAMAAGGGQGDSLAAGAAALPAGAAALVLLGDQPFAAPGAAQAVVSRYRREPACAAVSAALGGRRMPPTLFAPRLRAELRALSGDEGARRLLSRADADAVELGQGDWVLDLDSPGDLAALREAAGRDALLAAQGDGVA